MHRPSIVIVTPSLAVGTHGNSQTARRWAQLLRPAYRVRVAGHWSGGDEDLMIALHARRSAASVATWSATVPRRALLLVLTGTDLYRDIDSDAQAQASLALADALVVLNELGEHRLPPALRARCRVILQSCTARPTLPKTARHLRALMVGHLRDEKDPATYLRAARRLVGRPDILLDHVGATLDPALGTQAADVAATQPNYRWLGVQAHAATRRRIQAAHLLVHASRMEGGAHVVMEAIRSGTPVLASHIDGNVGLLGPGYGGYFAPGDDAALAALLQQARDDPDMLSSLQAQVALRSALFAPEAERAAVRALVASLLADHPPNPTSGASR